MNKVGIILFLIIFSITNSLKAQTTDFVSFKMKKRTFKDGKTINMDIEVVYYKDGKMITKYIPSNILVMNNFKGEVTIYDPNSNTVIKKTDQRISSKTSVAYHFLGQNNLNLGLTDIKFVKTNTELDDDYIITNWEGNNLGQFNFVKMVSDGRLPICLEYFKKKDKVKKTLYYDYVKVDNKDFPESILEIDYVNKKDSIITKSYYSSFLINKYNDSSLENIEIPIDAKLVK